MSVAAPPRGSPASSSSAGLGAAALGAGCASAALVPLGVVLLAFAGVLMALGWIGQEAAGLGHWIEGLFGGGAHPSVASTQSRPTEWLGALGSYTGTPAPSSLMLAIMQQTSGGGPLVERYWCGHGTVSDGPCTRAEGGTVARSYGLFGLIPQNALTPPPTGGKSDDNIAWQTHDAELLVEADLTADPGDWQAAIATLFSQLTPANWRGQDPFSTVKVQQAVEAYATEPVLGAWSTASWSAKSGAYVDQADAPEWVLVTGAAPTGPTHLAVWTPKTKSAPATHLFWRHLIEPTSVVGFEQSGRQVNFTSTKAKAASPIAAIPAYPGATDWGAKVPLAGPDRLVTITATWPEATETIDWPSGQVVSIHQTTTVAQPVSGAGLGPWVHDIKLAAAKTGVPARWIAAEMLVESGGKNVCFEGLRTQACGLMQLEPQTARDLPGWFPGARMDPQENLILGAELLGGLHRFLGSWRLAAAAYYGGLGAVEQALASYGIGLPTSWDAPNVALALDVVPDPGDGNHLTLRAYADLVAATERHVKL